ncbi:HAD-IA family hydrolase [Aestuariibacter sp. AA17]|uniref:HAD-IA family hydrolase n=1 Tax=Fluctibacter corallii TaxID=2984329 RepID=A0ABT3A6G8_9ALTE|nr:HAD-IA family hydrolase [Aestuariibacter sp. AA17]MCV2884283.1 HAD-IA family hydrolase [Aestuariibacter sp. AA17]
MKYELVIFDWDGTLMDSTGKITRCMRKAAAQCQLPIPSEDAVNHIIGLSLHPAVEILFGKLSDADVNRLTEAYSAAFIEEDTIPCEFFSGTHSMLNALRDNSLKLAVATGKARRGLNRVMEQTQSHGFFDASRCADEAKSKPHPQMILDILQQTNVSPERAIMVGDTSHDIKMAHAAGVLAIGVSHGAHTHEALINANPHAVVPCAKTLHGKLEQLIFVS